MASRVAGLTEAGAASAADDGALVATPVKSGANARQFVPSAWPDNSRSFAPVRPSNRVIGPAAEAEASQRPSGDQARSIT